eukprot:TRINITY_DN22000_c0_g1_i1.p1 TRINITY_DN22000_c0_g1~~TRINITY_DN22000_c0_g1_i1.p1  ORF type:complete len:980 (+),score=438.35 TRINITY_DN22000_c0_g1_i1:62-2941(+)
MPNVSGGDFGALGRDMGRILGGLRSSGDTSMISESTIPATSQSSVGGAPMTGVTSPNLNPAARVQQGVEGQAGGSGGGQVSDMLSVMRQEEEAAAQRAAEREARRQRDAEEAAARKEKLLAEQKARREARKAELSAVLEHEIAVSDDIQSAAQNPTPSTAAAPDPDVSARSLVPPTQASSVANTWDLSPDADASTQSLAGERPVRPVAPPNPAAPVVATGVDGGSRVIPAGAARTEGPAGAALYQACRKCGEWQGKCGILEEQIERERRQNAANEAAAAEAHQAELAKLQHRLEAQEEQIEQLATQNEVLNSRFEGRSIRLDIKSKEIEMVSVEDMKHVRDEIDQQEALLRQYQAEDERHSQEIRALRAQVTELQKQLLKHEHAQRKEKDASNASMTQEPSTKVVRDLTKENERLKEALRIKGEEADLEQKRLVSGRAALEKKLAAVDWQRSEDDGLIIRDLKLQLEKQQHGHDEHVKELEEKLKWYIANQDILTKHDALVDRQTTEIEALKTRLVEVDTKRSVRGGRGKSGGPLDQRKYIGELQQKIQGLEEIVKSKYPNSIPELIRACKPTETEVDMYRTMQDRIQFLNQELTDREEEYEKGIRQLRQEADRTLLEHQNRYTSLKEELKLKVRAATSGKVKELERKVDDTRAYYLKKVKELETQVLDFRKTSKAKAEKEKKHPKATTAVQTEEMAPAPAQSPAPGGGGSPQLFPGMMPPGGMMWGYPQPVPPPGYGEMMFCTGEVTRLRAELESMKREASQSQSQPRAASASPAAEGAEESGALRQDVARLAAELAAARAEAAALGNDAERLRAQLLAAESRSGEAAEAAAAQHAEQLRALDARYDAEIARLKQIVESNQATIQLAALKKGDRMEYLMCVRRKLEAVEHEYALREAELRRALDESKRLAAYELDLQKQKMNVLLQAKNNELEKFRVQLDALLDEMHVLRDQQPIAVP